MHKKANGLEQQVLLFVREHPGCYRPGEIVTHPPAPPAAIGRVLRSLQTRGLVQSWKADRGNGTTCTVWSVPKG